MAGPQIKLMSIAALYHPTGLNLANASA